MENVNIKQLRSAIAEFIKPTTPVALFIFMVDIMIYISSIAGVIFLENFILRILCGVIAGLKMASLFVIAHDAAHDSYTGNKLLNKIIGHLAFLPCYHNYSLWLIAHNRLHHQLTNLKGVNSWSPLSKDEYDNLPVWRQKVEKFYRCPLGISFNYLVERWWKDKFFPYKRLVNQMQANYWLDFILVSTYLIGQISLLAYVGAISIYSSALETVFIGFFIPFMVFCFMVGFSVYQQHTHETVPWFKTKAECVKYGTIENVTVHVRYPRWYNIISHSVMEHTAHHVDPRVPLYQLGKAQAVLMNLPGNKIITIKFSPRNFINTMSICKLYDYNNHCWLDFEGNRTSEAVIVKKEMEFSIAA